MKTGNRLIVLNSFVSFMLSSLGSIPFPPLAALQCLYGYFCEVSKLAWELQARVTVTGPETRGNIQTMFTLAYRMVIKYSPLQLWNIRPCGGCTTCRLSSHSSHITWWRSHEDSPPGTLFAPMQFVVFVSFVYNWIKLQCFLWKAEHNLGLTIEVLNYAGLGCVQPSWPSMSRTSGNNLLLQSQWATPLLSMGHRKKYFLWKIFVTLVAIEMGPTWSCINVR